MNSKVKANILKVVLTAVGVAGGFWLWSMAQDRFLGGSDEEVV